MAVWDRRAVPLVVGGPLRLVVLLWRQRLRPVVVVGSPWRTRVRLRVRRRRICRRNDTRQQERLIRILLLGTPSRRRLPRRRQTCQHNGMQQQRRLIKIPLRMPSLRRRLRRRTSWRGCGINVRQKPIRRILLRTLRRRLRRRIRRLALWGGSRRSRN